MSIGHHDHGQHCRCIRNHDPFPLELNHHHVWPLYLGGPDTKDNMVWLCPTGHTNVHEMIRLMLKYGRLTFTEMGQHYVIPVNRYLYAIAVRGYDQYKANSPE